MPLVHTLWTLDNIYCDYQLSDTLNGLKTVTTTAALLVPLWGIGKVAQLLAQVNVSSTPIST
jgi:hypothetical protein